MKLNFGENLDSTKKLTLQCLKKQHCRGKQQQVPSPQVRNVLGCLRKSKSKEGQSWHGENERKRNFKRGRIMTA